MPHRVCVHRRKQHRTASGDGSLAPASIGDNNTATASGDASGADGGDGDNSTATVRGSGARS
jgi:hypothetical protein